MEEANLNNNLDLYLSGKLSDAERDAFEKQLDMDKALQQELEIALKARAVLFARGKKEQKEAFAIRFQEIDAAKKARTRRLYMYAAAAVVSLLLLFTFFLQESSKSNEQLFAQYYKAPLASSIRDLDSISPFKSANIAFQQKQYKEASTLYLQSLSDSAFQKREEALFYAAISFLELKEPQKTQTYLAQLNSEEYLEMKNWYSALTYLQLDNSTKATEILEGIRDRKEHYAEQAGELLKELN